MIKVMIVDDHDLVRLGIRSLLEVALDIEVVGEAESGESAVALAEQVKPDVVLMDVHMPGIGGIEATRRIARVAPSSKVIALTVLDEDPFPAQLYGAGAMGYLTKGCRAEEMYEAVRTVHAGGRFVASAVARKHTLAGVGGGVESPFSQLSARELQVVMMILDGKKTQDISDSLYLSPKTVSTYRQRVYEKLGVATDVELTKLAFRYGVMENQS